MDPCWVEVDFVRGVTLADLCSHCSAARAQPIQPALAMQPAAASVISFKVGQQVWRVVGMENDRISGACGREEPVAVWIGNSRTSRKYCDAFVRGKKRGAPWLGLQSIEPLVHGGRGPAIPVGSDASVELGPDQRLGQLHSPGQRASAGGTHKSDHTKF